MPRLPVTAVTLLAIAIAAACGTLVPPTPPATDSAATAAPTATPSPTLPSAQTGCWIAARGEYRIVAADGGVPTAAELEDAARTVAARLDGVGVTLYDVRTEGAERIVVELPATSDAEDYRRLISARGDVTFVPLPADSQVEAGEQLRHDLEPLFGSEGVASATLATTDTGQEMVDVVLTRDAAEILDSFAAGNVGRQLAIAVDHVVLLAPVLRSASFGGRLQLAGGGERLANDRLVTLLRLPPLREALEEVRFDSVEPPPGCLGG